MLPVVVIAIAICVVPAAHAADLAITAVVAKSAKLTLRGQPASFVITGEDVARGHVDLPPGPRLDIRSNSREGFSVAVFSADPQWRVELRGGQGASVLAGGARSLDLNCRLLLAPDARPGTYPWPVQVIATPL